MKILLFAMVTTFLLMGTVSAQAPQTPPGQPAGRGPGSFGPPPELGPDDKQAFPDPPAGFNVRRENIPHGTLTEVPYDSKTLGTRRQIGVYLPPGYSAERKYPTLYLIHGLGWNNREWTAIRHIDVVLDNLIADGSDGLPEGSRRLVSTPEIEAHLEAEFIAFSGPEMRSFILSDPREDLKKLSIPVLAMAGSRDVQVVASQNIPAIAAALAQSNSSAYTLALLPGLNHLFQHCEKCTVTEYGSIEETFSPAALLQLTEWVARQ